MAAHVDGLVLVAPRMSDAQLLELLDVVPVVLVNRRAHGVPSVLVSPEQGLSQAVEHLVALGHREAVHLSGPADIWSAGQRKQALLAAAGRRGLDVTVLGPFQPRFSAGVLAADMALVTGATAVLVYNDLVALGVQQQLATREVQVGRDVSVVGVDDVWLASVITPALTTICVPGAAAGAAAVQLLAEIAATGLPAPVPLRTLPSELASGGAPGRRAPPR